ncbi:MAG: HEAT repeat domain-containing protein [Pseudomonadota bacterium]
MSRGLALLLLAAAGCGPAAEQVVTGLHSDNPAVRQDMAEFARKFDEPMVVAALIKTLRDPSAAIRLEAVESLGELGHAAATADLVDVMSNDPSEEVRKEAVESLGRIKDPAAVAPLMIVLQTYEPDQVPLNMIWALGNIGDRRALPFLSTIREATRDPYVIYNVNVALRKIR